MRRCALQLLAPLAILCAFVFVAQGLRTSPESPSAKTDDGVKHVSFATEDGATIYADVYGLGARGVVLAHGG